MLTLPFNGNIRLRINSVCRQNVVQGIFRSSSFSTGINGFPFKLFNGSKFFTISQKIKHTQGIDCHYLYLSLRIIVEYRSQIGRNSSNIHFPLHQHGSNLIHCCSNGKLILIVRCISLLILIHKIYHAHSRRAFKRNNIYRSGISLNISLKVSLHLNLCLSCLLCYLCGNCCFCFCSACIFGITAAYKHSCSHQKTT